MKVDGDYVDMGDGWQFWPKCVVGGCPNRICRAKGETRFCWPHSGSGKTVGEIIAENAKVDA